MKEAKELFFDDGFIEKLDQNPYLLSFNNFVVDFKNKTYRKGQPDDYISKCTNIDYIPLNAIKDTKSIDEINEFLLYQLPVSDDYQTLGGMINHIAGYIPSIGQKVVIPPYYIVKIEQASERKVESVTLMLDAIQHKSMND